MTDTLTAGTMLEQLERLCVAFPKARRREELRETAQLYHAMLRSHSAGAIRFAVDRVIREDEYFPKIARLRTIAQEVDRRTTATLPSAQTDDRWCPNCQSLAEPRPAWRPKVDKWHRVLLSSDGTLLLLEPIPQGGRLLCRCAPVAPYVAIEGSDPPSMRVKDLMGWYGRRCLEGVKSDAHSTTVEGNG